MATIYVVRAEGTSDTYVTSEASALAIALDYARKERRKCWISEVEPIG